MTRLRELISDKPLLAAYVAVAVTAMTTAPFAYDKIDKVSRMMDGELVTVTQAVKMEARANDAVREMARFAVGLADAGQIADVAAFRDRLREVSSELHSVHYPLPEGKSDRSPDPLAVYAEQLQAKGTQLQKAIWALNVWEFFAADGKLDDAKQQREKLLDILLEGNGASAAGLEFKFDESRMEVAFSSNP